MASRVRIGTCGFPRSHRWVYAHCDMVEVQQSFYDPPRLETVRRWRAEAPAEFAFSLKAWQLITHDASSPTYRRLRRPLAERDRSLAGGFRLNALTRMAWERTRELAVALGAVAVVLQTPASFLPTAVNIGRMQRFFATVDRAGLRLVFEPRGAAWTDEILGPLLRSCGLVHGVDPFLRRPLGRGLRYFRLHGRPAYHYHYRYSDRELAALAAMLPRQWPAMVLFNNDDMAGDAVRLRRLLRA